MVARPEAVPTGLFWSGPMRVLRANPTSGWVRIEAVGVPDDRHYDRSLTPAQPTSLVTERTGGSYTFDAQPRQFGLATETLRIQLTHAFDPQFAVSVSQGDPLPHQIQAVYERMLLLLRMRFLLADDPGAGKTTMAGLLFRELMQRQEIRRVLVLCPRALTDKWRREMWERFCARFTLVTGGAIAGAHGQNLWLDNDLMIALIDLAIQERVLPGLQLASWDLVIFDEAHRFSTYRYGLAAKIDKTKRYLLGERLAAKTRHLLLLTTTAHNRRGEGVSRPILVPHCHGRCRRGDKSSGLPGHGELGYALDPHPAGAAYGTHSPPWSGVRGADREPDRAYHL